MSCASQRRFYILSDNERLFLGYTKAGKLGMVDNLPWSKPYLFARVSRARSAAARHHGKVCYWPGRVHVNSAWDDPD